MSCLRNVGEDAILRSLVKRSFQTICYATARPLSHYGADYLAARRGSSRLTNGLSNGAPSRRTSSRRFVDADHGMALFAYDVPNPTLRAWHVGRTPDEHAGRLTGPSQSISSTTSRSPEIKISGRSTHSSDRD